LLLTKPDDVLVIVVHVDVFVDPAPDGALGFLPFMDAYATLRKALGDEVEIGYSTRTGLSPYILEDVERKPCGFFDGSHTLGYRSLRTVDALIGAKRW
jgi:hypothetical protein